MKKNHIKLPLNLCFLKQARKEQMFMLKWIQWNVVDVYSYWLLFLNDYLQNTEGEIESDFVKLRTCKLKISLKRILIENMTKKIHNKA